MKTFIKTMVILAICLCSSCSAFFESVKEKQVNFDTTVYGLRITPFDPSTGSASPNAEFGFGTMNYRSVPMDKGQPYYAKQTVNSIWSSRPASETIIWVGRATDKSTLVFEAIPDTMVKISADGIKSGEISVKTISDSGK